ncbi:MAG: hypothetical protein EBZ77_07160 [Chitinophagia bacterium]|nr:hypothetical protein [Chitinophagia bacterium]
MDSDQFRSVTTRFGQLPLTVVNEGLLMYLNHYEKAQLCQNIHAALRDTGGYWITADVYVQRSDNMRAALPQSEQETAFFAQHHIEENKFESYPAAEAFFMEQGFELVKEAVTDYAALSVLPQLLEAMPEAVRNSTEPPPKIQATWMLRAI